MTQATVAKAGSAISGELKRALPRTVGEKPIIIMIRQTIDRLTVVSAAFCVETYLVDTFKGVVDQNPTRIGTFDPSLKAKTDFDQGKYESLGEAVVRRHHRELNFQDVEKLESAFGKLDVNPFLRTSSKSELAMLFAERHLLVHRGGQINLEFVRKTNGDAALVGSFLRVSPERAEEALRTAAAIVFSTEGQIVEGNLLTGIRVVDSIGEDIERKVQASVSKYRK